MTEPEVIRLALRLLVAVGVIGVLFLAVVGAGALWELYTTRREH